MAKRNVLEYVSRPAETVIVLILIMFIVFFAQFLAAGLVWLYMYEKPSPTIYPDDLQTRIHRAVKYFLPDGTMHLVRWTDAQYNGDYTKEEVTDVNGNILWQGIRKDRPFKYLQWELSLQGYSEFYGEQQISRMLLSPPLPCVLEVPVRVGEEVREFWQYDLEAQVFAGYKTEGGLMGYLGADGLVPSKAQVQPLGKFKGLTLWTDEDPSSVIMLAVTKQRIYQIDFRTRKVETLFDSGQSDIDSIRWHQWRPTNPKERDSSDIQYRPLIDCRTADDRCHLIMREPNQILTVEVSEQIRTKQTSAYRLSKVDFTAAGNTVFLKYLESSFDMPESYKLQERYLREYDSKPQPRSLQLYKVAGDGKLELVNQFDWIRPVWDIPYPPDHRETIMGWASITSPPVFDLLWHLFGDSLYKFGREGVSTMRIMQAYAFMITEFRPRYSLLNCILSAAMMAFAFWHCWARRTSLGKLFFWLVLVGAFNLAGLLAYLALNHTPIIKCPACGRRRGLERIDCIRCGAELPVPQRRKLDLIFDT
ncbi:MAG: hypothetical protein PHY02_07330 [Phycisphaerae bacterium]|nr:hypothetical protein [Phycisphaerae bacterium]